MLVHQMVDSSTTHGQQSVTSKKTNRSRKLSRQREYSWYRRSWQNEAKPKTEDNTKYDGAVMVQMMTPGNLQVTLATTETSSLRNSKSEPRARIAQLCQNLKLHGWQLCKAGL